MPLYIQTGGQIQNHAFNILNNNLTTQKYIHDGGIICPHLCMF